jgi:Domain of unknown function (DUF6378)
MIKRVGVLRNAELMITKDRNSQYGEPEDNFGLIAKMWGVYLNEEITSEDVACMMIMLKVARAKSSANVADHWIDIAGYAACGGEIATKR